MITVRVIIFLNILRIRRQLFRQLICSAIAIASFTLQVMKNNIKTVRSCITK